MLQSGLTSFYVFFPLLIFSRSGPVRFHVSVPPKGGFFVYKETPKIRQSESFGVS
jgi:hypothetical protein